MYFAYGTWGVIPTYLQWGVLQPVTLLPRGVCAKIYECGTFIYGVVLVTVMTTLSLGRCVRWNFLPKRGVLWTLCYGYTYLC